MPARKKRTPSPKSALVAVQSQISSLEDEVPVPVKARSDDTNAIHDVVDASIQKETATSNTDTSIDMMETILSQDPSESELSKKNVWLYRFGYVATCVITLSVLCIYAVYMRASTSSGTSAVVPTVIPTVTPEERIDPKSITIEVLNASGISGKASKTAESLRTKGYTIISTGNAKKIPVTSVIFSRALTQKAQTLVLSDLQSIGLGTISATIADSSISARITIGLK